MTSDLLVNEMKQSIFCVRQQYVMLDCDLAKFYGISTKRMNEYVRRHSRSFPQDFMFQLTQQEYDSLKNQSSGLKNEWGKHRKHLPFVFTEAGAAMLASLLKKDQAIEVRVSITRAFIQSRRGVPTESSLDARLVKIEKKLEEWEHHQEDSSRNLLVSIQTLFTSEFSRFFSTPKLVSYSEEKKFQSEYQIESNEKISQIRTQTCQYFGIREADFNSPRRTKIISLARQIAMFLVRRNLGLSYQEIGAIFGGRDHTTVLHACRNIEAKIVENGPISIALDTIQARLAPLRKSA